MRLAYSISGNGPPLVRAPHFFSHLEHERQIARYSLQRYRPVVKAASTKVE